MTGSEKIVAQILDEARQAGDQVLAEAENEAARILKEAEGQAAAKREETLAGAAAQAEEIGRAALSAAQLIKRNRLLEERRRLLQEALEKTGAYLRDIPEDAYFAALEKLIGRVALQGKGLLLLNARDKARLPGDFISRLNGGLPEGRSVEVSADTVDIDGGFILQYDDIEMNCGFSAMIEAQREALEDLINRQLFS